MCLIFSIFLKIDAEVQWSWTTTLWAFWCSLAVQVIITFFALSLLGYSIYDIVVKRGTCEPILANLWACYTCGGFVFATTSIVMESIDILEDEDHAINWRQGDFWTKFSFLIYPCLYLVVFVIFTMLMRKQLIFWFEKLLYNDENIL